MMNSHAESAYSAGSNEIKQQRGYSMKSSTNEKIIRRILLSAIFLTACAWPSMLRANTLSTDVIGMFPKNVGEFAYADLRAARAFSWFPQLKEQMLPARFRQFETFLTSAGIDPNSQVEELAWALVPNGLSNGPIANNNAAVPQSDEVVGVALGSFRPATAESYFKAQKLPVINVRNFSLYAFGSGTGPNDLFFFFLDSNTAAFGQRQELEHLIAVRFGEEQGIVGNNDLYPLITAANGSGVVWAVLSAPYTRLAMQQLVPETTQFPAATQLVAGLHALTIQIVSSGGIEAHFEAVCASTDAANTFAALLSAGLMYQRYQVANSNPDLATLLDQATILPSGDRLDVRLKLTDDQVMGLIRRNTFAITL
jgi:hypothetical protein